MAGESLPPSWKWTTFGTVADFVNGDRSGNYPTQSERVVAGVPFINTGHIDHNGRLTSTAMDYITRDSFERLRSGKVRAGDIVYCLRGSTIGKTARNHFTEGAIASSLVIIRAKANACQEYLYFYLTSPFGQQLVGQYDNGSAQPNLSVRSLCNYPLPLPPVPEQRAIAHILGTMDDKIELNRRISETLEAMARALFRSWFVDFDPVRAKAEGRDPRLPQPLADLFPDSFEDSEVGEIPRGWDVGPLGALIETVKGRSYKSEELVRSDTALVTLKSFARGGGYRPEGLKPFAGTYKPEQVVTPGELVIACTDVTQAAEVIGRPAIVRGACGYRRLVASLDTLIVRPRDSSMTRSFLYFLGSSESFVAHTYANTTGTTVLHLAKDAVPSFVFPRPPMLLVKNFDALAGPALERIQALEEESGTLTALREVLLPKLVFGELRVKDPEKFIERVA